MIHTEGIGLDLYKKHVVATLNDFFRPLHQHTVSKRLPILV